MRVLISILLLLLLTATDCVSLCDRYPTGASHFIKNGTPYDMEITAAKIGSFGLERENSAKFFYDNYIKNWQVAVFNRFKERVIRLEDTLLVDSRGREIILFNPIYIRYSNGRCDTLNKKGSEVTHPIFYDFNLGNVRFNEGLTDWEIYDPFPDRDCDKTIEYTYVFSEAFYNRSAPCNAVSGSGLSGSSLSGG